MRGGPWCDSAPTRGSPCLTVYREGKLIPGDFAGVRFSLEYTMKKREISKTERTVGPDREAAEEARVIDGAPPADSQPKWNHISGTGNRDWDRLRPRSGA